MKIRCKMSVTLCIIYVLFLTGIQSYRLPRDVIPKHYSLKIQPDFNDEIFFGEVLIYIMTSTISEKIILHSSQLNITNAYLNGESVNYQTEPNEMISVKFEDKEIQPGMHTLRINFKGKILEGKYGFLKAPFKYNGGQQTYIYVTDLEPTHARKVFPCFDEPFFKTRFNIRLVSPNETYLAISNMPEINKFKSQDGIVYDFEPSVVMSTYLVSFAFTRYPKYQSELRQNNQIIPISIYTLNASEANNKQPIEYAKKALQFYTEYTGIPYPLSKLDMIEYERNESAATENWGLITFRTGLLTPNLRIFHESQIQLVVFHELSHFWFGNLVTNDWWSDLWLQEGFASFMSYKLSAQVENSSQIKLMKEFQFDRYLDTELEKPEPPIVSYIANASNILEKFGNIVYDKGANVLLMLETIIGEKPFKEIIRKFLKKFAYKTVSTNDFIETVEEFVPNQPIRSFMESYLYQEKYPVINVEEIETGKYKLTQQAMRSETEPNKSEKWTIPITYKTDTNDSDILWFDRDMESLEIREANAKWLLLNVNSVGGYKTNLSTPLWDKIIKHFPDMDKETAHQVVSEAFYLFKYNIANCDIIINLMKALKNKDIWSCFSEFYLNFNYNFLCNNYDQELDYFTDFLNKRFLETKQKPLNKLNFPCTDDDVGGKLSKKTIQKCARWIVENLKGTEDTTVKQIL